MSPTADQINEVRFEPESHHLRTGDLLLFRPRPLRPLEWLWPLNWFAYLICTFGRSEYCHAGIAVACHGTWFCAEMVEGQGGRLFPIDRYLKSRSGAIDVYTPDVKERLGFKRHKCAVKALELVGRPYGYGSVLLSAILHFPIIRQFSRVWISDQTNDLAVPTRPMYCSAGAAWAARIGGTIDPVPQLADCYTEPGDLARSSLYKYQRTLTRGDQNEN